MTPDEIRDLVRQAADLGAHNVVFTGGEPTLLGKELPVLLRFIRDEAGIASTRLVTNGLWATSYAVARRLLAGWQEAGLVELNISCGEYHQEFVPLERVVHAWRAARDLDYATVLLAGEFTADGQGRTTPDVIRRAIGEPLPPPELASPFARRVRGLSCGAAMNYGRGLKELSPALLRHQSEERIPSRCTDLLSAITCHPHGRVTACCGIMVRDDSLLTIGDWRQERLRPLLEAAHDDLILNWIRYLGLKDMKAWLRRKDPSLAQRTEYISICDLCADLIYDPRSRAILLEHGEERRGDILAARLALQATVDEPERFTYAVAMSEKGTP